MDIVAAVFVENMDFRQVPGPSTRIDLSGIFFSLPAPSPVPVTLDPHMIVLVRCPTDDTGFHALNATFFDAKGAELLKSKQPVQVEPGKFGYRLVRAELTFEDYGTVEAHTQIDDGPATIVPLTLLPPVTS
jgi:hypothetical protein